MLMELSARVRCVGSAGSVCGFLGIPTADLRSALLPYSYGTVSVE